MTELNILVYNRAHSAYFFLSSMQKKWQSMQMPALGGQQSDFFPRRKRKMGWSGLEVIKEVWKFESSPCARSPLLVVKHLCPSVNEEMVLWGEQVPLSPQSKLWINHFSFFSQIVDFYHQSHLFLFLKKARKEKCWFQPGSIALKPVSFSFSFPC